MAKRKKAAQSGEDDFTPGRASKRNRRQEQDEEEDAPPRIINTAPAARPGPANKRPILPGTVRKLSNRPVATKTGKSGGSTQKNVTLSGNRINKGLGTGGFEATIARNQPESEEELFVTRKTAFSYMLKRGLSAFVERRVGKFTVKAMGAAIPVAMSLALAIQDNLPCSKDDVNLKVTTDSCDCVDEVIPPDEQANTVDIAYQTRTKSTIAITLSIDTQYR